MIQLRTETLVAMRDRLRERGAPPSVARPGATLDDALSTMIHEEYGPLCETMYLMMRADGDVGQEERDVLRGALRELDERIRTAHVEKMIATADEALGGSSVEARLRALASSFRKDEVRGEVAFVLAAAIAFADDRIAPEETSLLEDFADALGIDEARSEELLRSLVR